MVGRSEAVENILIRQEERSMKLYMMNEWATKWKKENQERKKLKTVSTTKCG